MVNTTDGTVWVLHTVTSAGLALYAVAGACSCPSFLLATLAELAERGITGRADVLPVPVGPEPDAVRLALFEEELAATGRLRLALESAQRGRRELRARVAELEALTPAPVQTCRVCGAGYTYGEPCSTCAFRARMAAESGPTPDVSADRLTRLFAPVQALREDEPAEVLVPRTERSYWVGIAEALNAALAAGMPVGIDLDGTLTDHNAWSVVWDRDAERWTVAGYEDDAGGPDVEQPALTVFRAQHDSIVMGLYTTAAAARAHCEAEERHSWPKPEFLSFDWVEDEEDGVAELTVFVGGEECATGYVVTPVGVASEYDEEADK